MATPTTPERRLLAAGAKKGANWGTANAVGANDELRITADGGLARKQPYLSAKEANVPFISEGDFGPVDPVDFAPEFFLRYDPGRLGTLIAQLFGTAGTPANAGSIGRTHTFQWADSLSGIFSTVVVERPGKVWEITSAKPYGLSIGIENGIMKGTIRLRGNTLIDNSAVNAANQADALTFDGEEDRVKFTQGSIKVNAESGNDVANETALQVNDITIEFSRSLDAVPVAGATTIIEPNESDYPSITVRLGFPRMNSVNANFFSNFTGETEQKMLIKFTGATIENGVNFDAAFYFPRLRITEIDYPFSEIVPGSMTLVAEKAASAPTGMNYTVPYFKLVNKEAVDYLG